MKTQQKLIIKKVKKNIYLGQVMSSIQLSVSRRLKKN